MRLNVSFQRQDYQLSKHQNIQPLNVSALLLRIAFYLLPNYNQSHRHYTFNPFCVFALNFFRKGVTGDD